MNERCPLTEDAAGWVLGALETGEGKRFSEHLPGCSPCTELVAELRPVVDVLAMSVPQLGAPDELKGRIMSIVSSEAALRKTGGPEADRPARHTRRGLLGQLAGRPVLVGAIASAALAAGIGAGLLIDSDGAPARTSTFQAKVANGSSAFVTVAGDKATLHLENVAAPPSGRVYQVWLRRDGVVVPTRTLFTVPADGAATVTVDDSLRGADRIMVSDEPRDGSPAPTGDVVLQAIV